MLFVQMRIFLSEGKHIISKYFTGIVSRGGKATISLVRLVVIIFGLKINIIIDDKNNIIKW